MSFMIHQLGDGVGMRLVAEVAWLLLSMAMRDTTPHYPKIATLRCLMGWGNT